MYNILYKGQVLYTNVTIDKCADIMSNIALDFYQDESYDLNELKLEKINYGNDER